MTTPAPTGIDRRALIDARVTLNGQPATISGRLNRFATVRDLRTGLSCEWSWEAADRIVNTRNGEFHS